MAYFSDHIQEVKVVVVVVWCRTGVGVLIQRLVLDPGNCRESRLKGGQFAELVSARWFGEC